jgi:DNA helicase INO80
MFNIVERNNRKPLAEIGTEGHLANLLNVSSNWFDESELGVMEPCARPGASAPPIALDCSSQFSNFETENVLFNVPVRTALYGVTPALDEDLVVRKVPVSAIPTAYDMLPEASQSKGRYTHITVPSMRRFVSDCGKLARLDALLKQLKEGNHRVLLYFQMTRMIDMMEEYLTYRNYTYCRLDGSTKLEDRRDTVHDFQTRSDIFIFLLSTRAGGLGINLTSADTVIFYDSDWNPTIDSQAMDRAHRLGQTKQVTVYRLITRGTIEERIRKRALQKEEVQRVVISGQTSTTTAAGGAVVDFNTRSRENRTKDIALWLADDEQAEEIERREQEALAKGEAAGAKKTRKSVKRAGPAGTMEDMYHEGEFDVLCVANRVLKAFLLIGEGHFEDSAKPSGAATPIEGLPPVTKRKRGISKKAKTMKQRLAIADGEVNV